jgi:hypothetical protein
VAVRQDSHPDAAFGTRIYAVLFVVGLDVDSYRRFVSFNTDSYCYQQFAEVVSAVSLTSRDCSTSRSQQIVKPYH